jgi:hypothetical protein
MGSKTRGLPVEQPIILGERYYQAVGAMLRGEIGLADVLPVAKAWKEACGVGTSSIAHLRKLTLTTPPSTSPDRTVQGPAGKNASSFELVARPGGRGSS